MLEESACQMSGQTSGSSREKPGATPPKAVSDSIPYGQQPKLSLQEAFRRKPSKAAQGIWDQQSMESESGLKDWRGERGETGGWPPWAGPAIPKSIHVQSRPAPGAGREEGRADETWGEGQA
ncbi:hypothetical protein DPX16_20080 [Anabarilius grahami]|uniref:Uncharacterized protein n=1 Tax=Anabarilius grahami TaxID=495550 RepID=A0A3N0XSC1_ANAGA|nr:hypothetical protein DPX16_20080 [Anabarilius grahami]